MFLNQRHPISCIERQGNKTNQQVSYCQRTVQEFRRRVEGIFLVKGNKDEKFVRNAVMERRMSTAEEKVNL